MAAVTVDILVGTLANMLLTLEATPEAAQLPLLTMASTMKVTSGIFTVSITSFIIGLEGDRTS